MASSVNGTSELSFFFSLRSHAEAVAHRLESLGIEGLRAKVELGYPW